MKSRGSNLSVHFKDTCDTAQAIKGMHTWDATSYLKHVALKKPRVPIVVAQWWSWSGNPG